MSEIPDLTATVKFRKEESEVEAKWQIRGVTMTAVDGSEEWLQRALHRAISCYSERRWSDNEMSLAASLNS